MTNTTATTNQMGDVIDAMRSVHTESDRWVLSEALLKVVPNGTQGFSEIIDQAAQQGIAGGFTVNTLRFYRDTAKLWPANKRVKNVSFSAHREVERLGTDIDGKVKLLEDLYKNPDPATGGPNNVTVAAVRRAVTLRTNPQAATSGPAQKGGGSGGSSTPAAAGGGTTATASPKGQWEAIEDLKNGGKQMIAAVPQSTSESDLQKIGHGLNAVLSHVDQLRAKKAAQNAKSRQSKPQAQQSEGNGKTEQSSEKAPARRGGITPGI